MCLLVGLGFSATTMALDEVLEVEVFNASAYAMTPGADLSLLEDPDNAGHDYIVEPRTSQEMVFYLPEARGTQTFTYHQGEQACLFGFGHSSPVVGQLGRWVDATSTGTIDVACASELIPVPDDDEFVRNGGTRVLFTLG